MIPVPVDLAHVHQLQPDRIAVFDYSEERAWAVRQAGFGFIVVEHQGVRKIVAVGRKSDLVGKCRQWGQPGSQPWGQPYITDLGFEPKRAYTAGGWFARWTSVSQGGV